MSSSISAFDERATAACVRWLLALAATLAIGLSTLYVAIVIIDPFGTGYFTPIRRTDIVAERYAFANATRVRDQRFNAAIIGNSRMMRLAPQFLDQMTGARFVMLAMPALWPEQQATVASVFVRRHNNRPLTLVWGVGDEWCLPRPAAEPFPDWLYEQPGPTYFLKVFSPDAARHAWRRLLVMLGLAHSKAPADGYEPLHPYWNRPFDPARFAAIGGPEIADATDTAAPSLAHLAAALAAFGTDVRVLFVVPPVFARTLPVPGSAAEIRSNTCKSAIQAIASARTRTGFLDLTTISLALDPQNFVDPTHFQDNVAREIEREVANALRTLNR